MRFTHNDVNFDVTYDGHQKYSKCSENQLSTNFDDFHMQHKILLLISHNFEPMNLDPFAHKNEVTTVQSVQELAPKDTKIDTTDSIYMWMVVNNN